MAQDTNLYDAVIVGGGPAGLTAALYLARARYRVIVVEKDKFGGQITITEEVVNYPGVERTSGTKLTETMRKQAESFGAELRLAEVTGIDNDGDYKVVHTSTGDLRSYAVLLAVGSSPRAIGFPGEAEFKGHGVAYCATCDGEFFTGKDVFVVGGGFAAAEESVFLTKYAKQVHLLIREPDFTCAPAVADGARNHPNITIDYNTEILELTGDSMPRKLVYQNNETGDITTYDAPEGDTFGVFVLAGYAPATGIFKDLIELDQGGNIVTDASKQTSAPGIYAAGDVTIKNLRQVVTATGEAAAAATEMERYLAAMHEKTGVIPTPPATRVPTASKERATAGSAAPAAPSASALFDEDAIAQLNTVFGRMENAVILELALDDRSISQELRTYADEMAKLTDKVSVRVLDDADAAAIDDRPCVRVLAADGTWSGLAFHGVPGGHEFTSFVLGLYNVAGPGQPLGDDLRAAATAIDKPVKMQVLVSLSCTMCPDTVVAAQRIAALNPNVTTEVYDAGHYPELKDRYNVMSVPCLVVNEGGAVSFGKKGIADVLGLIG
ncbi:MAG: FAD-dependent oxidoreductase [Atopobiaceae bacterium]|nr:FAD-dependent oxidoreductase [Atopobiaceae bacterium]